MPQQIEYQHGIPESLRGQAVGLYDAAFGNKFSAAIPSAEKRVELLIESLQLEHAFAAIAGDRLVGLAGYSDSTGSLTGGISYSKLVKLLGIFRGNWAALIFGLYERKQQPDELLMDGIAVADHWRGSGIGTQLLSNLESFANQKGYHSMRLDVIDTNFGARKLYERCGFIPIKTESFGYLRWLLGFGGATTLVREIG